VAVVQLNASKREITGKATRRLRHEGRLPAVLYGQSSAATSLELDTHEFERVFARSGKTQLIDLVVGTGRPHKVLVKEVQVSPRRSTFLHVDFHQVSLRERMQVEVPISVFGEAEPVRAGEADVLQVAQTVRVECLPARIPEVIEIDISGLPEVDAAIHLADLQLPEGVTAIGDPDEVVVKLAARRVAAEEEAAEAPAEEGEAEEGGAAAASGEEA
jgi:large subunit ribosomal protein L25